MHVGLGIRFASLLLAGTLTTFGQSDGASSGSVLLSEQVTNAVLAGLPKFQPKATKPEDGAETTEPFGMPERKNKIIRLPQVVVQGERPPVFREQDIYTPEGLRELALKRYFSGFSQALNRFKLPLFGKVPEAYAMARWEADERLRVLNELKDEIGMDRATGNDARANELSEIVNETMAHKPLFLSPAHAPYRDARGQ